ncbi:MAG: PhzF family phenazine biosynthesis protein, partial [Thermoplasmata archaeon]|nr:PhzF family phenazine biosynthesis protein [Thermoplasmata archaeon]
MDGEGPRRGIRMFQVDAFTDEPFKGNPAAVCLMEEQLDDTTLLAIAAENNL